MGFCPFFSAECPQDYRCAVWTRFGCCMMDKPGVPAVYTGGAEPVDVFILHYERRLPAPMQKFDIIYASAETGEIGVEDDMSKFNIIRYFMPDKRNGG